MNPKEFKRYESIFDLIPIPIQIWEKKRINFNLLISMKQLLIGESKTLIV
ncbi:MAG: hypothetical protein MUP85_07690 [Candidatus Lokiarchaeota archaeon]|nr:hypothetical protein [Candidatus Lokiarchaeota archaeon]